MIAALSHRATAYLQDAQALNRNCWLCFLSSALNGLSRGIFSVVFNLYILSLGIEADMLGRILSAAPFAQALGSIPVGFLAEIIGFKKSFVLIYGIAGLAKLAQVSTDNLLLISTAALVGGLAYSGDFVVRLPFLAANSEGPQRAYAYSLNSILFGVSMSLGALFAGYAPNRMRWLSADLTLAYRYTLYIAGALALLSLLPNLLIQEPTPHRRRRISLYPYLWGMDRFTLQQAIVSLFVGLSVGSVWPFMNLYFVYHLRSSREFFGTVAALTLLPSTIATALGPLLATHIGTTHAVSLLRFSIPLTLVTLALTTQPLLAALGYWCQRALFSMSQPLSFTFAMEAADRKAKAAVSAWLNVTFWLGIGLAAPITGFFIARANYALPLYISSAAIALAAWSNHFFFAPLAARLGKQVQDDN